MEVRVLADAEALAGAAAEEFVRQAEEAVQSAAIFTVALSGGATPKALFSLLADGDEAFRARVPWDKVQVFWGDERHVPPDHPDSNYRMANETLLSRVPVPPGNVRRIRGEEQDAGEAATSYERTLRETFRLRGGDIPRFDLILLGMGPDGHTASLFPGTPALHERTHLVVAQWVAKLQAHRITLTPPVLNNAASIMFLVSGEEKAEALREVLQEEYRPDLLPAQIIRPTHGRLLWLVDGPAAQRLDLTPRA